MNHERPEDEDELRDEVTEASEGELVDTPAPSEDSSVPESSPAPEANPEPGVPGSGP